MYQKPVQITHLKNFKNEISIKEGDEVITTPFTFYATIGAIVTCGAIPKFVDVKDDYNIANEWMKYYKKIGVDHFYLFYNGKIEGDVYNYFSKLDQKLFTLIEWNYKFYFKNS